MLNLAVETGINRILVTNHRLTERGNDGPDSVKALAENIMQTTNVTLKVKSFSNIVALSMQTKKLYRSEGRIKAILAEPIPAFKKVENEKVLGETNTVELYTMDLIQPLLEKFEVLNDFLDYHSIEDLAAAVRRLHDVEVVCTRVQYEPGDEIDGRTMTTSGFLPLQIVDVNIDADILKAHLASFDKEK